MGLFKRNKNENSKPAEKKASKVKLRPFEYHPKIILAWAKGIEGHSKLLDYLHEQGFNELVMATHAIRLKDEAREWLMQNGYPHVMAMINAAEGNAQAKKWLMQNNFLLFYNMAIAIDGDPDGFKWINKNSSQEYFLLTKIIKDVKDEIEEGHNDIHKRGTD